VGAASQLARAAINSPVSATASVGRVMVNMTTSPTSAAINSRFIVVAGMATGRYRCVPVVLL
jgi:hypothetical protein